MAIDVGVKVPDVAMTTDGGGPPGPGEPVAPRGGGTGCAGGAHARPLVRTLKIPWGVSVKRS